MTRKAIHEFEHKPSPNDIAKTESTSLRTIKCLCGAEILVMPDLAAMNQAIKMHLAEHKKSSQDAAKRASELAQIEQSLIEQLFRIASE